jgi:hypothetical protein
MRLVRLAVSTCCNHPTIKAIAVDNDGPLGIEVRSLTPEELKKVVDIYNAVADAAEGSNHLPYQMTYQLLKESDIAESVI